jgi:integrase
VRKRRISRTITGTRAEATAQLQRLLVDAGCDLHGGTNATVGELLEQFMLTATLAPTTRQNWEYVIARHLVPAIGDRILWRLTARDCDGLYAAMLAKGVGPSRVSCTHVVLHRAVAQAVRWGWIPHNPVVAATRPVVPRVTITPPDAADVRRLLQLAEKADPVLACWLQVSTASGARRGEICGLRWSDIDLDARTIRIQRSVSATKTAGVFIKTTKTGRVRQVSITSTATHALRELRDRTETTASLGPGAPIAQRFVFTNDPTGQRPWRPELVSRRWERLRATAGLDHVRLHDLRHFVATELLTAGIDVRTVANRLGHARTSTTMDIYWAYVPARDRDAANHLEAVLAQPSRGPARLGAGYRAGQEGTSMLTKEEARR